MQEIITKAKSNYEEKKPFVLYSHPESDTVEVLLQKNIEKYVGENIY